MKGKLVARYERESTLWKNANGFYQSQDWTRMDCIEYDYTEEIETIKSEGMKWIDDKGNDVTESILERCYGKPYLINFVNKRRTNEKSFYFKTKEEANQLFIDVLKDRKLGTFKRVK